MRNGYNSPFTRISLACVLAATACGCGGKGANAKAPRRGGPPQTAVLNAGIASLDTKAYDDAIAKADEFLAGTPHGEGSAEALYLKGRSLEAKNAAGVDANEAASNLQAARTAYIEALGMNPKQPLESYLRTAMGNVAYFQDDYPTAIAQLSAAYDRVDRDDLKPWILYRVGLAQQRLGQFAQADQTFAKVQQAHAGSEPAKRAREHQGAKAFYVQLATFATPAGASKAAADLKKQGVTAAQAKDPQGRTLLRVGPLGSYSQAIYFKSRFAGAYPDALVIP